MGFFAAITLPQETREALEGFSASCGRIQSGGIRYVASSNYHITLFFIGDIAAEKNDEIIAALSDIRLPRIHVSVKGTGTFPLGSPDIRVVWAGVEMNHELAGLASEIELRLCACGIQKEL